MRAPPETDEELAAITIGDRPPRNGPVRLAHYDPAWPALYEAEARKIRTALGLVAVVLEHVGSTSIPGLSAKPVLDILLVVAASADEAAYFPDLEAQGYRLHVREPAWHEHRVLKGVEPDVNLDVFSTGSGEITRMLAFRDRLRRHSGERELYERTKRELAARTWRHAQHYANAKSEVVEAIIARASAA
jgi:GrpB-like predicted nucleotidyltransferase (UPF0157 family)